MKAFMISKGESERTRALYERLLDRTKHYKINHWDEVVVTNDLQMDEDEDEDDNEEDDQEVYHRNRANKNVISWDVGLVYAEP
ncbi:hypothetical protein Bca52824_073375 [Brassica carinata]|uniref:Uncharacterized protein n=1 Tax=Brassica carinata TaxID=52824 RepID=A0A8X7U6N1_BRACI|nr:hypothetical protein Bca52824_073375 [Brassica carinata]